MDTKTKTNLLVIGVICFGIASITIAVIRFNRDKKRYDSVFGTGKDICEENGGKWYTSPDGNTGECIGAS